MVEMSEVDVMRRAGRWKGGVPEGRKEEEGRAIGACSDGASFYGVL
jgi:hypothetical protein